MKNASSKRREDLLAELQARGVPTLPSFSCNDYDYGYGGLGTDGLRDSVRDFIDSGVGTAAEVACATCGFCRAEVLAIELQARNLPFQKFSRYKDERCALFTAGSPEWPWERARELADTLLAERKVRQLALEQAQLAGGLREMTDILYTHNEARKAWLDYGEGSAEAVVAMVLARQQRQQDFNAAIEAWGWLGPVCQTHDERDFVDRGKGRLDDLVASCWSKVRSNDLARALREHGLDSNNSDPRCQSFRAAQLGAHSLTSATELASTIRSEVEARRAALQSELSKRCEGTSLQSYAEKAMKHECRQVKLYCNTGGTLETAVDAVLESARQVQFREVASQQSPPLRVTSDTDKACCRAFEKGGSEWADAHDLVNVLCVERNDRQSKLKEAFDKFQIDLPPRRGWDAVSKARDAFVDSAIGSAHLVALGAVRDVINAMLVGDRYGHEHNEFVDSLLTECHDSVSFQKITERISSEKKNREKSAEEYLRMKGVPCGLTLAADSAGYELRRELDCYIVTGKGDAIRILDPIASFALHKRIEAELTSRGLDKKLYFQLPQRGTSSLQAACVAVLLKDDDGYCTEDEFTSNLVESLRYDVEPRCAAFVAGSHEWPWERARKLADILLTERESRKLALEQAQLASGVVGNEDEEQHSFLFSLFGGRSLISQTEECKAWLDRGKGSAEAVAAMPLARQNRTRDLNAAMEALGLKQESLYDTDKEIAFVEQGEGSLESLVASSWRKMRRRELDTALHAHGMKVSLDDLLEPSDGDDDDVCSFNDSHDQECLAELVAILGQERDIRASSLISLLQIRGVEDAGYASVWYQSERERYDDCIYGGYDDYGEDFQFSANEESVAIARFEFVELGRGQLDQLVTEIEQYHRGEALIAELERRELPKKVAAAGFADKYLAWASNNPMCLEFVKSGSCGDAKNAKEMVEMFASREASNTEDSEFEVQQQYYTESCGLADIYPDYGCGDEDYDRGIEAYEDW